MPTPTDASAPFPQDVSLSQLKESDPFLYRADPLPPPSSVPSSPSPSDDDPCLHSCRLPAYPISPIPHEPMYLWRSMPKEKLGEILRDTMWRESTRALLGSHEGERLPREASDFWDVSEKGDISNPSLNVDERAPWDTQEVPFETEILVKREDDGKDEFPIEVENWSTEQSERHEESLKIEMWLEILLNSWTTTRFEITSIPWNPGRSFDQGSRHYFLLSEPEASENADGSILVEVVLQSTFQPSCVYSSYHHLFSLLRALVSPMESTKLSRHPLCLLIQVDPLEEYIWFRMMAFQAQHGSLDPLPRSRLSLPAGLHLQRPSLVDSTCPSQCPESPWVLNLKNSIPSVWRLLSEVMNHLTGGETEIKDIGKLPTGNPSRIHEVLDEIENQWSTSCLATSPRAGVYRNSHLTTPPVSRRVTLVERDAEDTSVDQCLMASLLPPPSHPPLSSPVDHPADTWALDIQENTSRPTVLTPEALPPLRENHTETK